MRKPFGVQLQYFLPQRIMKHISRWVGDCRCPRIKNWIIKRFIKHYNVDMSAALIENPTEYPSFNSFFTRLLKPELRPIAEDPKQIACPADGCVSQLGKIKYDSLLQAKGFDFNLTSLLGGSEKNASLFRDGHFATIYLSPKDYHRVHMPFAGKLRETIFIPGKLFSVNQETAQHVPNLFARNERLVSIFDTEIGPMAVIMVGAMIVGSISTVWHAKTTTWGINVETYGGSIQLDKGAEMGYFKTGSTVIVLFGKEAMEWSTSLKEGSVVQMGQSIGTTA